MATINDLLPPELLVKIFSHYIESERRTKFLKNVAPVCKLWYSLSTASPLWENIAGETLDELLFFADRDLLRATRSFKVPCCYIHRYKLLAVLPKIGNLKALDMTESFINRDIMVLVAKHFPNLERLVLKQVRSDERRNISLKELEPILTTCGPKLKYLDLSYSHPKESKQVITKIAANCPSLEGFKFMNMWPRYISIEVVLPIGKLQRGCPQMRELEISSCKLIAPEANDYSSGFENLSMFRAIECNFHGIDIYNLLKNSTRLKYLQLDENIDLILGNIYEIPSNKVEVFDINIKDLERNFESVERTVEKWKRTLEYLFLLGCKCDITSLLKSFIDANPNPKLKSLQIECGAVDPQFFKTFIVECKNLNEMYIEPKSYSEKLIHYKDRGEVEQFAAAL